MPTLNRRPCRFLIRTPVANVQAAAVLVLGGAVAFACGTSGGDGANGTSEALSGGDACEGVQLDASRQYTPKSWTDANVHFAVGSLTFTVPSEIPVTQGQSDHGKTKLTFSLGGGTPTTCVYRGNGGTEYLFVMCKQAPVLDPDRDDDDDEIHDDGPSDLLPHAGSSVTADSFTLHVNKGDKKAGATSVSLNLGGPVVTDDNLCTTDACSPSAGVTHTPIDIDDGDACTVDACDPLLGIAHTLVDTPFCRGEASFSDGTLTGLGGNGRACSTCHVETDDFQLVPSTVEARFQALQLARVTDPTADDPLFRAIDADDFRTAGPAANSYTNLRRGLVRVSIPLPSNIKLVDPASCFTAGVPAPCQTATTYAVSTETVADVWRSVPTVLNVNVTGPDGLLPTSGRGPNPMGGYQLDARVDTLQNQAFGALVAHAAITNPSSVSSGFLDDLAAYQQALVTPPEGPLTALEQQGKDIFTRACATCHGGAGLSTPFTSPPGFPAQPRYHNIQTAFPRATGATFVFPAATAPAFALRTFEITQLDGFKMRRTTTDMGRALLTGVVTQGPAGCAHPPCGGPLDNDFGRLDIPTLRNISNTAPYFSNNSAATLDAVLDHYDAFFAQAKANNPTDAILSTSLPPTFDRPVKSVVGVAGPGFFGAANGADGGVERAALLAYLNQL